MSDPKEAITAVRLAKATVEALDALAAATDRSRSWHIQQAIAQYLLREAGNEEYLATALRTRRK